MKSNDAKTYRVVVSGHPTELVSAASENDIRAEFERDGKKVLSITETAGFGWLEVETLKPKKLTLLSTRMTDKELNAYRTFRDTLKRLHKETLEEHDGRETAQNLKTMTQKLTDIFGF